ncbi:SWI/SNF-related matrix-associated actin-dependent regulator of chromatin subfamily A-like protein 1 isoform X2 [Limulus polyphemus]|uniref:SWI/SNF-related matrix-associated actin-dependent regulator of chromatin subfamily A-like protein 1 isoform X2 n=1 Tax=Limulus polyphemus TaxID=6850 RepID=A0ABM1SRJ4_LIMPO|nr:SWI/SNF-related matrix-associated actin-dependent regulator of chromatin subfamily A-like protein 1 isoform X2 [Limulus polyphemus]XP_022246251.1 SWI/SNF-related matrix-associated actin-dependent regulator of chromatin subfamily A-like protein 1 isoform X2 [Limulus polyphemus]XP_022246252.1 SWI/SNF-related matrix-associated actin-dependent regulator of chromatin subfamily A-like protein 1 isoform X2 [Limulus polyphemus]XP_022246253.1 SWI/SNF-related matrix-associated actin-dependent regulator
MQQVGEKSTLSEEQRKKIEENRQKALQKRAEKQLIRLPVLVRQDNVPYYKPSSVCNNAHNVLPCKNSCTESKLFQRQVKSSIDTSNIRNVVSLSAGNIEDNLNNCSPSVKKSTFYSDRKHENQNTVDKSSVRKTKAELSYSNSSNSKPAIQGVCVLINRKRFQVEVGFHQQIIEVFKTIPSKVYDAKEKQWNFAVQDHDKLIQGIIPLFPNVVISPLPPYILRVFKKASDECEIPSMDLSNLDLKLQNSLLPFQRKGVSFGIYKGGRLLIADDMGLGKTIQAIGIADYYKDEWPLLIVAPSSVRYTWAEAFHTWLPSLDPQEINVVNSSKDSVSGSKVVIMSYDILTRKVKFIQNQKFQVVIMDESHFLKNFKSARTQAALVVMKTCKRVILLSGTPALSRPMELYTQISAINNKVFPNYTDFGIRYCNGKIMPWGWDFTGSSHMTELQLLLEETVMIRRLKAEVITQLPAKRRQMVLLDPSVVHSHKKILEFMSKEVNRTNLHGMERRGKLLQYFRETGFAKLSAICDYIKDLLEAERKFLCFGHHQSVLDAICKSIKEKGIQYIRIDGSTSSETRKQLCDKFQFNDTVRVAVLSITAANSGINLTAAHMVIFAELFWNPGILTQAEDRAHRIGQQDSVVVQYLVAQGTADDHIWPLVQKKLEILNKAGLSKDNFSDADTTRVKGLCQSSLDDFLEDLSKDQAFLDELIMSQEIPS